MTAEDFLQEHLEISYFYNDKYDKMCCLSNDVQKAMKEYAKLKCQELLLLVAEKAKVTTIWEGTIGSEYVDYDVDRDSIINAVDLETFCS